MLCVEKVITRELMQSIKSNRGMILTYISNLRFYSSMKQLTAAEMLLLKHPLYILYINEMLKIIHSQLHYVTPM